MAGGQCGGMRGDHRTRWVGKDLRGHRVQPNSTLSPKPWHRVARPVIKGSFYKDGTPPLVWGGMFLGGGAALTLSVTAG